MYKWKLVKILEIVRFVDVDVGSNYCLKILKNM